MCVFEPLALLFSPLIYVRCTHLSARGQASLTFYVEQNGSADFELLVVDQNVELAGVDARVGRLHRGDQQPPVVHGAPRVRLELVGRGVLSGGGRNQGCGDPDLGAASLACGVLPPTHLVPLNQPARAVEAT